VAAETAIRNRERPPCIPDGPAADFAGTADGIKVLKPAPQAPRMNAHAERAVRMVRAECSDRLMIYGEQHLRRVPAGYAEHDNTGRPHRALQLRAPGDGPSIIPFPAQGIQRHKAVGGLLYEYRRAI
jgi:putative transposase